MPLFRRQPPSPFPAAAAEPENLGDVLAEVRRIEVQTTRLVTDVLAGGYRSTFRGVGVEFSDVREYVEGDDPRTVDWNVTARVGRPFVKRFVEERERTLLFVLDLSPSMAHGLGAWSLRQTAARFCAILGLAAIQNHDRVGLVAGGERTTRLVLPRAGGGHVLRVVRDCLTLPTGSDDGLDVLLADVGRRIKRRAVVFVLSDFLAGGPAGGYEQALQLCGRRHDVVAVRLLPQEMVDPPRCLLHAIDPRTGHQELCDFADDAYRAAWLQRVHAFRHHHDETLGRTGIDGIEIEVPSVPDLTAIAQPLLRFFRRRELRRHKR